jgi:WXG100 family type VII secretion target
MDLPGRPTGNADALRAAAHAWDHLAWELWQLSRALERKADALAQGWSGAAGDAFTDVWRQMRTGFYELDGRIHDVAGRLRRAADAIEGGQAAYDRALAAVGIATVAGIGLTVLTLGLSDAAAAEADSAIAATAATIVADLEASLARVAALFAESAEALGGLAGRFAVNFALRAPELAYGPLGGGAIGASLAVAGGARDPGDIVVGGLLGAAESVGPGRGGRAEADSEVPATRGRGPTAEEHPTLTEQAWRHAMTPAQIVKQRASDARAAARADPANYGSITTPLTSDVAQAIERRVPGSIRFIDREIVNPASASVDALTDLDIETDSLVIQIKSGDPRKLSSQLSKSHTVTGKTVVGFAPDMSDATLVAYQRRGYVVFRDITHLIDFVERTR